MSSPPGGQQRRTGVPPRELRDEIGWLRRVARSVVSDRDSADDLVQETLIAAHYQPWARTGPLRPWLRGILRNVFRMQARTDHRRRQREDSAHLVAALADGAPPGPEEAACRRMLSEEIERLPEPYRTTLTLRFFEGLRAVEIADELGIPAERVRKRTETGLALLRERLDDRHGGDRERWRRALWVFGWGRLAPRPLAGATRGAPVGWWRRWLPAGALAVAVGVTVLVVHQRLPSLGAGDPRRIAGAPSPVAGGNRGSRPGGVLAAVAGDRGAGAQVGSSGASHGGCPSLRALVAGAAPGSTVDVPACVFREETVIDKPLTLRAAAGAAIMGSDVWHAFARDGALWKSRDRLPSGGAAFSDGQPLRRVEGTPAAGEYAVGADGRIVVASDPGRHVVEVAVRSRWLRIEADDVTVSGFEMRHAADPGDNTGALAVRGGARRAVIRGNRLAFAEGVALSIAGGGGHVVEANEIVGAGKMGAHLTNVDGAHFEGNRVAENRRHGGGGASWQAAGVSLVRTAAVLARNTVLRNRGAGIFAIAGRDSVVRDNVVAENAGAGVIDMSSARSEIRANRVWSNGWRARPWEAGVIVASSRDARVQGNVLAWNAAGVVLLKRGQRSACDAMRGNVVADNDVFHAGARAAGVMEWRGTEGDPLPCADNEGRNNRFWYEGPAALDPVRFRWGRQSMVFDAFQTTPAGHEARLLSAWEKDAILAAAEIPTDGAKATDRRSASR